MKKKPSKFSLYAPFILLLVVFLVVRFAVVSVFPYSPNLFDYCLKYGFIIIVSLLIWGAIYPGDNNNSKKTSSNSTPKKKVYTLEQWNKEMDDLIYKHDRCANKINKLEDQKRYLLSSAYNMDIETKQRWLEEIEDELRELKDDIIGYQSEMRMLNLKRP